MTEQDLIKFKVLSMQDGRLNLQWFAEYVAEAEREACAKVCEEKAKAWKAAGYFGSTADYGECAAAIRARGKS
jgi:hypothetical protein